MQRLDLTLLSSKETIFRHIVVQKIPKSSIFKNNKDNFLPFRCHWKLLFLTSHHQIRKELTLKNVRLQWSIKVNYMALRWLREHFLFQRLKVAQTCLILLAVSFYHRFWGMSLIGDHRGMEVENSCFSKKISPILLDPPRSSVMWSINPSHVIDGPNMS